MALTGTENAVLSDEERWLKQERKMFSRIENDLHYYSGEVKLCRFAQRNLSISVMIFGVLTPVVIAEAGKTASIFGSQTSLNAVATGIAALAAILEGIRRICRFDRRWIANYSAATKIRRLRDEYRSMQIGKPVGSEDWRANIFRYQQSINNVLDRETAEFFKDLDKPENESSPNDDPLGKGGKPEN
ncbi:DUF4231 domain-containing protein [Rhizobium leguminosarum bv. viciae]|uniref:DUF4231 domain-containing protein n=2 Tax=Rhizobium leguminosarum TaxID=384 RepID=A0A8I2GNN3_RHILV|nr:DUF4231 domain-containing protein [Rhizobium leguminosarum]NKM45138.1 DUF4231 domain-containing protein [Rhizobium leguminosarum bv. viciae]